MRRSYSSPQLDRALPRAAFRELFVLSGAEAVRRWAKKWRVDAPAMIRQASQWLVEPESFEIDSLVLDHFEGTRLPTEWVEARNRMDALLSEWHRESIRLEHLSPDTLRQELRERVAASYLDQYKRDTLRTDSLVLAPLSADPLIESYKHFARRAQEHYLSRQQCLKDLGLRHGFTMAPPVETGELAKHASWTVAYQVQGSAYRDIAAKEGLHHDTAHRTIQVAVTRFARDIGLPLRRTRAGRPPTRRT